MEIFKNPYHLNSRVIIIVNYTTFDHGVNRIPAVDICSKFVTMKVNSTISS